MHVEHRRRFLHTSSLTGLFDTMPFANDSGCAHGYAAFPKKRPFALMCPVKRNRNAR